MAGSFLQIQSARIRYSSRVWQILLTLLLRNKYLRASELSFTAFLAKKQSTLVRLALILSALQLEDRICLGRKNKFYFVLLWIIQTSPLEYSQTSRGLLFDTCSYIKSHIQSSLTICINNVSFLIQSWWSITSVSSDGWAQAGHVFNYGSENTIEWSTFQLSSWYTSRLSSIVQ